MSAFFAKLLRRRTPGQIARAIIRRIPALRRLITALRTWRRPPLSRGKLRRRNARALARFLRGNERIALPSHTAPEISIVLVLFNQAGMTLACLRSIAATVQQPAEVIIVDNASSDETGRLLTRLDGARIFTNADNRHFLHAANQGAAAATGEAVLLLNNDATLRPGTMQSAWRTLMASPQTGAVGGPIVLPDGTLQEAGSIVFSDGTCLGYGRGADPAAGAFGFQRRVDYCSGAFLLIRRPVFVALGGLDTAFAPAYYEETDFCLRLRQAAYDVVYDPGAIIDHFEFASAASTEAALALQQRHHALFTDRHQQSLQRDHHPPGTNPLFARARDPVSGRVLMIEDRLPHPSLGTGYPRAARLLAALGEENRFVTLYPLVFDAAEARGAFSPSVEIMHGLGEGGLRSFLAERVGYYDHVVVCRPHNMRAFLRAGGRAFASRLIYDAEAVFAEREIARAALTGIPLMPEAATTLRAEEMALAREADIVLAVSPPEAALFRAAGCADVRVLGHALLPRPTPAPHAERRDLLLVGALHDDPSPNVDGLLWFVEQVMPALDALIGAEWRLRVAGRAEAARVQALAGPRVALLGRVPDLAEIYNACRVVIAPMRYAGGIPHKVHEAAAYGLPVVTTPLLARQLGWRHADELYAAETPSAFAACCAELYQDPAFWMQTRAHALAALERDCNEAAFTATVAGLLRP